MSPRTGRPVIGKPKNNDLKVRLDDDSLKQLDEYCKSQGITRAEAVRTGIKVFFKVQTELENAKKIRKDLRQCLEKSDNPQVPIEEHEKMKLDMETRLGENEKLIETLEKQLQREIN